MRPKRCCDGVRTHYVLKCIGNEHLQFHARKRCSGGKSSVVRLVRRCVFTLRQHDYIALAIAVVRSVVVVVAVAVIARPNASKVGVESEIDDPKKEHPEVEGKDDPYII
jgi:hypothetical protein